MRHDDVFLRIDGPFLSQDGRWRHLHEIWP